MPYLLLYNEDIDNFNSPIYATIREKQSGLIPTNQLILK